MRLVFSDCPPPSVEELRESLRRVAGTMAIDGFILTRADKELIVRALKGEITDEEFTRIVLEKARA
jgi:hypothetical protein